MGRKKWACLVLSLWGPVVCWAGIIFYLSNIPGLTTDLGIWDLILRKLAHVVEFGILTLLIVRAVVGTYPLLIIRVACYWSGGASFFYAISDEIHQAYVPLRGPSILDVFIDSIGIIVSLILYSRFMIKK